MTSLETEIILKTINRAERQKCPLFLCYFYSTLALSTQTLSQPLPFPHSISCLPHSGPQSTSLFLQSNSTDLLSQPIKALHLLPIHAPPSPLPWLPWLVQSKEQQSNSSLEEVSYQSWATITTARCFYIYWTLGSTVVTNLHGGHVNCARTLHLTADPKKALITLLLLMTFHFRINTNCQKRFNKGRVWIFSSDQHCWNEAEADPVSPPGPVILSHQNRFVLFPILISLPHPRQNCWHNSQWAVPTSLSSYTPPPFWSVFHCFIKIFFLSLHLILKRK